MQICGVFAAENFKCGKNNPITVALPTITKKLELKRLDNVCTKQPTLFRIHRGIFIIIKLQPFVKHFGSHQNLTNMYLVFRDVEGGCAWKIKRSDRFCRSVYFPRFVYEAVEGNDQKIVQKMSKHPKNGRKKGSSNNYHKKVVFLISCKMIYARQLQTQISYCYNSSLTKFTGNSRGTPIWNF